MTAPPQRVRAEREARKHSKWVFIMAAAGMQYNFKTSKMWPQPYPPAAQDWLPTEAKQGWAGQ